ncbi:MAG: alpha/beta fold hydrolase [Gaiellaceae bacterium]
MPDALELSGEIAGVPVAWREVEPRTSAPVLYVHGVPTEGGVWLPFLERTGGYAPDLPGFGRSGKPGDFDYSAEGYARFLEAFLDHMGVDRYSLVVHDWGAVGLALAQRAPARVERLAIMDTVPLLSGYRWHRVARIWRTPVAGELLMGFTTKFGMKRGMRRFVSKRAAADELAERIWANFDHGTQRAILRLYRSADPPSLAKAGERLAEIDAPALVLWGERDPFIPPEFARRYAEALGGQTTVEIMTGAGHWLWLDRPEAVDAVTRFMEGA